MIEVDQLTKTYGSIAAIKDVSFKVEPGEILGFLGPNGAGKTTTMRILAGYLPATRGTARIAGKDVHTESMAVRQRIGYLPETPPLYPEMTVEGFLSFVAQIKGVSAGDRATQITSAIERCNLQEKRKVIIRKLSKGFRQRVGIAQAIVHNPPVIILDEPTVGLDPRQIIEVRHLIKSLAGEHTIILSTHILPEVSATCDRIAIINQGEIVATDSPERLVERLTGQGGYTLELRGEPDRCQEVLTAVPGVMKVSAIAQPEGAAESERLPAGHYRFQVVTDQQTEDVGDAIAAAVVSQGLGLSEIRRSRASLEDVFINLTTQEPSQEPGQETSASSSEEDVSLAIEPDLDDPTAKSSESERSEPERSEPESSESESSEPENSEPENSEPENSAPASSREIVIDVDIDSTLPEEDKGEPAQ